MILQSNAAYTFSQIFDLSYETEEILTELGHSYQITPLSLPHATLSEDLSVEQLQAQMRDRLPYVPLNTEAARREFYVTPVLFNALDRAKFKLSIEYNVTSSRLYGTVDYLLRATKNVVIVEAKRADMERGFTQLASELIALAEYRPESPMLLYGAITTGDLWRFGLLNRETKQIIKDANEYLLPRDLAELFQILLGLLEG